MIHVDKNTVIPSVEQTLETLRTHNEFLPQFLDFDKAHQYIAHFQMQLKDEEPILATMLKIPKGYEKNYRNRILNYLYESKQTAGLESTKTGFSLSEESIQAAIDLGQISDEAVGILRQYQKVSKITRLSHTLMRLMQNPVSDAMSCDKHRMLLLHPEWHPQNTGRVAMRNPAVQNLPRELQDLLTVPYGYVILHTDSGQIEPRVIYSTFCNDPQIMALINLYNDAYFGLLHYTRLSNDEVTSGTNTLEKFEITDDLKAIRKDIKTMGNAVMYGSKSNVNDSPVKAAMIRRIGNHPLRLQKIKMIEEQLDRGNFLFSTAFGTKIDIRKSDKLQGITDPKYYRTECIKLAINNPIQGTAADLMRLSVAEANHILTSKAKNSYIINYIHDAGTFAIHEDDYDKVADELADVVSYDVPGWIPIHAEPEFGRQNFQNKLFPDIY